MPESQIPGSPLHSMFQNFGSELLNTFGNTSNFHGCIISLKNFINGQELNTFPISSLNMDA